MNILQRAPLHGVVVDVVCVGRFYDFFEKRDGRWAIVRRQPIYEKDRLDPVDPSATLALDQALLASFPEGYRHLGYLQASNGFTVKQGLPGLRGPEVEKLYAEGRAWLAGSATPGEPGWRRSSPPLPAIWRSGMCGSEPDLHVPVRRDVNAVDEPDAMRRRSA